MSTMITWLHIATVLAGLTCCLTFTACDQSTPSSLSAAETTDSGSISLPRLDSLRLPSVAEAELDGEDYSDDHPSNLVSRAASRGVYRPDGSEGLMGNAFAVYFFDLSGFGGEARFAFHWIRLPEQQPDPHFWLALADWQGKTWRWFAPEDVSLFPLADITPFLHPDTGQLAMVVLVGGTELAELRHLSVLQNEAPVIAGVSPLSGYVGAEVKFSADVPAGSQPLAYAWDFGNACDPPSSTDAEPVIVLGESGLFDCSLSVTNDFGEFEFPFALEVRNSSPGAHTYGLSEHEVPMDIKADSEGNLVICGYVLDGQAFVYKLSPTGELLWARSWGIHDYDSDVAWACVVDDTDNIYLAGGYGYIRMFDTDAVLLVKYNSSGEQLWALTWDTGGGAGKGMARDIALDGDGNLLLCGEFSRGTVSGYDVMLLRFSPDGELLMEKMWSGGGGDFGQSLAIDNFGILHVTARSDSFTFGDNPYSLYLRFDRNANILSSVQLDWTMIPLTNIGVAPDGTIVMTEQTGFVYKFNSAGNMLWCREIEPRSWTKLAISSVGQICLGTSTGSPNYNPLIAMLNSSGNVMWAKDWEGNLDYPEWCDGLLFTDSDGLIALGSSDDAYGEWRDYSTSAEAGDVTPETVVGSMVDPDGEVEFLTEESFVIEPVVDTGGGKNDVWVANLPLF